MTTEYIPYIGGSDKCPRCGYPQVCPCSSCVLHDPHNPHKRWTWERGDHIKCANCGLIEHIDYWEDWAYSCVKLTGENV